MIRAWSLAESVSLRLSPRLFISLSAVFVSPALVMITTHYGEVPAQSAVQALLAGIVLLFLQLAINWQQLDVKVR